MVHLDTVQLCSTFGKNKYPIAKFFQSRPKICSDPGIKHSVGCTWIASNILERSPFPIDPGRTLLLVCKNATNWKFADCFNEWATSLSQVRRILSVALLSGSGSTGSMRFYECLKIVPHRRQKYSFSWLKFEKSGNFFMVEFANFRTGFRILFTVHL